MLTIDDEGISYGNIAGMYRDDDNEPLNGSGLQVDKELDYRKNDIHEACDMIADLVYGLHKLITDEVAITT